jgi:hypothetical protein
MKKIENNYYMEIANDSTLKYVDRSYALSKIAKKNLDICSSNLPVIVRTF